MILPTIGELIPHRPPMLLLDRVVSFEAGRVVCSARPTAACIFAREGAIPSVVTLEFMAQAAAACLALARPYDRGASAHGLLIAARQFSLACAALAFETELAVEAALTATVGAAASLDCEVSAAGTNLARAALTVYLPSAPP